MGLQESGEMYLETILRLQEEMRIVRAIDVAEKMDYSKASVSRAVKILKNDGYIEVERTGNLLLTKEGEKLAKKIYDRHTTLTSYLENIGIDPQTAEEDACRIEHVISDKSFNVIKKIVKSNQAK
ncbi:metal-dependent transcriptional regulator [Phoenicibacter congonensis]|uniref:metal-dependent transcriptional regulator n=1 Tax=Phoenicibacter congonensis TaxID=1944646 RepID=UPI0009A882F1|nr:metal-dependent transcriptional regulator [Phoenicibacter congonensis]